MTLPSFFILVAVGFLGLVIVLELGGLPGRKAAERNHPQAEAINVQGWVGLLLGGVGWMVALTWAHMKPMAAFAPVEPAPEAGEAVAPDTTEEAS